MFVCTRLLSRLKCHFTRWRAESLGRSVVLHYAAAAPRAGVHDHGAVLVHRVGSMYTYTQIYIVWQHFAATQWG